MIHKHSILPFFTLLSLVYISTRTIADDEAGIGSDARVRSIQLSVRRLRRASIGRVVIQQTNTQCGSVARRSAAAKLHTLGAAIHSRGGFGEDVGGEEVTNARDAGAVGEAGTEEDFAAHCCTNPQFLPKQQKLMFVQVKISPPI